MRGCGGQTGFLPGVFGGGAAVEFGAGQVVKLRKEYPSQIAGNGLAFSFSHVRNRADRNVCVSDSRVKRS